MAGATARTRLRGSPMTTVLYTHPACLDHDPGRYHPESPARLRAVLAAFDDQEFSRLERREAPEASREDLLRVHPRRHIDSILDAVPETGHVAIDADTVRAPTGGVGGLRPEGGVVPAGEGGVPKEAETAFGAVRPPGH